MSDGQVGVSPGELNRAISSVRSEFKSDLNSLESSLKSLIAQEARERISADQNLQKQVSELKDAIMQLDKALRDLMGQIANSFQVLENSVGNLIQETKNVGQTVLQGDKVIVERLQSSEKTTEKGLNKISASAAITDVMKARAEAGQAQIAIDKSLGEIENRFSQAKITVDKKQREYDKHFSQIADGFKRQARVISQHVYELIDEILPLLPELGIDALSFDQSGDVVRESQKEITNQRTEKLSKLKDRVDLVRLARFQTLRKQLEQFISNENSVRLEQAPGSALAQDTMGFGLPVNAVMLKKSEFIESPDAALKVFSLQAEVRDCYSHPVPEAKFAGLNKYVIGLCAKMAPDRDNPLGSQDIGSILEGMQNLVRGGLLKPEHFQLIKLHLETYPVQRLES